MSSFFGGLEARIGAPDPKIYESMAREHTREADSLNEFEADNYGVMTTPRVEWWFVAEPSKHQEMAWPLERRLAALEDAGRRRAPLNIQGEDAGDDSMTRRLAATNEKLDELGATRLLMEEHRRAAVQVPSLSVPRCCVAGAAYAGCLGNCYVTTIHAINPCLPRHQAHQGREGLSRPEGGVLPPSSRMRKRLRHRDGLPLDDLRPRRPSTCGGRRHGRRSNLAESHL